MPSAFASPTWRNVSEALRQHRTDCAAFAVEVESVLASLATLRESLQQQDCQLARERASLAERGAEAETALAEVATLRQTLQTREAQVQAAQAEVEKLKAQLSKDKESAGEATGDGSALQAEIDLLRESQNDLREQLADMREQRDAALARCDRAEGEVCKLTSSSIDALSLQKTASEAQADSASARKELNEVQSALAAAREETASARKDLAEAQAEWLERLSEAQAMRPAEASAISSDWSETTKEQFAAFQLRVEQTLEECAKWAAAAIQATETREELAALRSELQSRSLDVERQPSAASGEWERERGALETELEMVRARAAELYESLSRQERGLSELRCELGGDLKQLRRLVESQAELMLSRHGEAAARDASASPVFAAKSVSGPAVAEADPHGQEPADPVLSSVMAQFARLQQDVAERRKKKKP